nr:MAG TPA: Integrase [Caudoviricetes sp.]
MASYLHYERYCPKCAKYLTEKRVLCPKCRSELKSVNKWYVRFRALEYGEYKQKKLGAYNSKKEAERAYLEYESGIKRRENPVGITFGEVCDDVLKQIKAECKTSSWIAARGIYGTRLLFLQKIRMIEIDKTTLLDCRKKICDGITAERTNAETWAYLGRALRYASLEYDIDRPYKDFKRIKTLKKPKTKKEAWTVEDWQKFNATVKGCYEAAKGAAGDEWTENATARKHYIYYVFFNYLFYMANRKGEATALKVKKIDFENHTVLIDESVTNKITAEERGKGKTYAISDRKTHNALVEDIPEALEPLLKEYIETLNLKPNDFMFYKSKPLAPQSLRRDMDKYIALAGVKRITPHQFRHTHATIIFSTGASKAEDAYIVAHRLGHSVKYSLDTYGDLYKEREKEVMKNFKF